MSAADVQAEALERAQGSNALSNLPVIFGEFMARGIPEAEIMPRVNVFTFNAWRALGRTVRRGEKGVRVVTWVPVTHTDKAPGEKSPGGKRPKAAYVFHVTQTMELPRVQS